MQIAQRLFQGVEVGNGEIEGLITYHRTDSTTLQREGAQRVGARDPRDVRRASTTTARGGIRPRSRTRRKRTRRSGRPTSAWRRSSWRRCSSRDELRLYELIWKRTMASQMVDARVLRTTRRDHRADRRRRTGRVHRHAARRSSSPASAAPTSKAATIRRRSSRIRRRSCRRCRVGDQRVRAGRDAAGAKASRISASSRSGTRRCRRRATPKRR